ncbi:MAG TPA: hypothetical protein VHN78_15150 [Chloroflexota bacterium]|nr:hypothetical protein [Chloroflexota bacterium]
MRQGTLKSGFTKRLGLALSMGLAVALLAIGTAAPTFAAVVVQEQFPLAVSMPHPCIPGEEVAFSGTFHTVVSVTKDAAGGLHAAVHSNLANFQGTGTSGAEYVLAAGQLAQGNLQFTKGSQAEVTFTQTTLVIRKGSDTPADDFLLHLTEHITVNANGELTVSHFRVTAECK